MTAPVDYDPPTAIVEPIDFMVFQTDEEMA